MTISELYTAQKKVDAKKNLIGTIKFFSIAMPLLLVWAAPVWFKAHAQIPVYQRDCRSAPSLGDWRMATTPCYQLPAVGSLKNYYRRTGSIDSQDLLLDFPDGQALRMDISGQSIGDQRWTHAQADGSCSVELWHGQITAVLRPGAKILARCNPEVDGSNGMGWLLASNGVVILGLWAYLLILWRRGDLRQKTMR